MSSFKIPENYNEALQRKEEVLNLINSYNEALFNEQDLPLTDEEIASLQEEYAFLDEFVGLTATEKAARKEEVETVEVVSEDGTVEHVEKKNFWDKVNPLILLYGILPIIGSLTFCIQSIGLALIYKFIDLVGKYEWDISGLNDNQVNWLFMGIMSIYPILFNILTFILVKFVFKGKETKLIGYIILALQFVISIISMIWIGTRLF